MRASLSQSLLMRMLEKNGSTRSRPACRMLPHLEGGGPGRACDSESSRAERQGQDRREPGEFGDSPWTPAFARVTLFSGAAFKTKWSPPGLTRGSRVRAESAGVFAGAKRAFPAVASTYAHCGASVDRPRLLDCRVKPGNDKGGGQTECRPTPPPCRPALCWPSCLPHPPPPDRSRRRNCGTPTPVPPCRSRHSRALPA